ncbi:MAG: response regulator [Fibrobacter sp.]|nr:response regulator [Fibrobacter sp.]
MNQIFQKNSVNTRNTTDSFYNNEILIVDDFPFCILAIEMILHNEGFKNTKSFEDPIAVLQYAYQSTRPSVVITDFQMPKINGVELLLELDIIFPGIDGIIVTGLPDEAHQYLSRFRILEKGEEVNAKLIDTVLSIVNKNT